MSSGRRPSGFLGDLHSYVAHQQQSFKEARDARGALLSQHEEAWRVRNRRNTENGRTAAGMCVKVTNPVPAMASTVGLDTARDDFGDKVPHLTKRVG